MTSFTTATAFIVNVSSPIPALRFFGIFMCALVVTNFLLVISWYPCVLILWEKYRAICHIPMPCLHRNKDDNEVGLGRLESYFYYRHAPFIRKFWWLILILVTINVGIAGYAVSQIEPAAELPTLFPSGEPLQRYIEFDDEGFFDYKHLLGTSVSLQPDPELDIDVTPTPVPAATQNNSPGWDWWGWDWYPAGWNWWPCQTCWTRSRRSPHGTA